MIIAGIRNEPIEETSAIELPEIPPKNMETRQFTMAVPPRIRPIRTLQNLVSRSLIPPSVMICAMMMKNGTHMKVKLVMPVDIFWNKLKNGMPR